MARLAFGAVGAASEINFMPLIIRPFCAMCGKEPCKEFKADYTYELNIDAMKRKLEANNWIVQINGLNFDIYCSPKCAK